MYGEILCHKTFPFLDRDYVRKAHACQKV